MVEPHVLSFCLRPEAAQILERLDIGVRPGPFDRGRGRRREGVDLELPQDREIMVADQAYLAPIGD